jgi:flagellar FliL protein
MAFKAQAKKAEEKPAADVDDPESDEEGAAKPKRKFSLRLILIAAGALTVLLAAGGTAAYFLFGSSKDQLHASGATRSAVFVDLPDVLVNLSNTGSDRTQYLKVKIVLELPDQALIQQIQPVMPRLMDAFQTYLRELRPTDLDGSAALYRLKEELTRRVNASIAPNRINAVLFKEIVIQ